MEQILIFEGDVPVCEVVIGTGVLGPDWGILDEGSRAATIAVFAQESVRFLADRAVARLTASGRKAVVRVVPDRDAAKTLAVAEECYRWLNVLGMTRHDAVVGVGGGALTDLVGFVAGTYMRGIEAVLVPTTILGAVDAAIGGKSAVNVDGKNLVGVFRHPQRVLIDLDVLDRLPLDLRREGSAEALKTGLISDLAILDLYERYGIAAPLAEVVRRAVGVKARIVSADFREEDSRAFLNYGHTVGHAIETSFGISHGEAISIGMIAAAEASRVVTGFEGLARQRAAIEGLGLPVVAPEGDAGCVRRLMDLDKKREQSGLRMVLLEDFGAPIVRTVDDATVKRALAAVGLE